MCIGTGMGAAAYVKANGDNPVSKDSIDKAAARIAAPFKAGEGPAQNPYLLHAELQQVTNDLVGIIRTEKELVAAKEKIKDFQEKLKDVQVTGERFFNPAFHIALDLENMLLVAGCIAGAGLIREESRGGHTRDDYPKMDPNWRLVNLHCSLTDSGEIKVEKVKLPDMPNELLNLFEKDELSKYMTEPELVNMKGGSH